MDWQALRGALTSYTKLLSGLETSYFSSGSELPRPQSPISQDNQGCGQESGFFSEAAI